MGLRSKKLVYFLMGIFMGIIVGASVFWWMRSIDTTRWISFSGIQSLVQRLKGKQDDVLSQLKTKLYQDKSQNKAGRLYQKDSLSNAGAYPDSLKDLDSLTALGYYEGDGLDYYIEGPWASDSVLLSQGYRMPGGRDTLVQPDTGTRAVNLKRETKMNELVRRDEMLLFRLIRIQGIADTTKTDSRLLDSLLTDERSGFRKKPDVIRVEFWRSPVNYRGYRITQNKIILFGINDPQSVSLEFINRRLYLRHHHHYYLLDKYDDFRPLVMVSRPLSGIKHRQ